MSKLPDTKTLSLNRWIEILTRCGVDSSLLDGKHKSVNAGSINTKDGFRYIDKNGDGYTCLGHGEFVDGFGLLQSYFSLSAFSDAAAMVDKCMGWSDRNYIPPTAAELAKLKEEQAQAALAREQALKKQHAQVAKECVETWNKASPATDHPYLLKKGVQAYGLKVSKGKLLVPVRIGGELTSLQYIDADGGKMFHKGGNVSGGYFSIAGDKRASAERAVVCEGYATGASIREATGQHVAVAFNAGNLQKVAQAIRTKLPDACIVIAADNDQKTSVNTGLDAAVNAAEAVKGLVALPAGKQGSSVDWNDIHQAQGLEIVAAGLANAVEPKTLSKPNNETGADDANLLSVVKVNQGADSLSIAKVESELEGEYETWGNPQPLPDALLPVKAFDADMLPDVFRNYALDVASRMQCPIEFVAVSIMTTFGGVVGKRCSIHPKAKDDWLVIPNLWGALVGRPSTMKSPAITAATAGVDGLVQCARSAYAEACEESEVEKMVYDAEKKTFKDSIAKAVKDGKDIPSSLPEKPSTPIELRYITNAGTVENLIKLLSENENGIIQLRDELMGWMRSMDNPSSQDARSFYLEAWNGTGSSFSYDTMAHGHLCLETGACVSVLGGIQPSLLAEIVHNADVGNTGDDGMLQRFQMLVYPDRAMSWSYCDRKPNKTYTEALRAAFSKVVDVTGKARFDSDAQPIFVEWYTNLMQRIKYEDHLSMESHLSKFPQLMPALALLIHVAEHVSRDDMQTLTNVSKEAALKAVKWCEFLESHARRIYAMGDSVGVGSAKKVIQQVVNGKLASPFKLGDLQRKNLAGLKGEQAKAALELLEQYGWIKMHIQANPRGKPTEEYTLHPHADFFLKSPDTPLTIFTIMEKNDNSDNSEGVTGAYQKNNAHLTAQANGIEIMPQVGELGLDGKIVRGAA